MYRINGEYHKELMTRAFSAIEFLFRDILGLRFETYEGIIDTEDIDFLHDDMAPSLARKADIAKEFKENRAIKFKLEYSPNKFIDVSCPICETESLAVDGSIKCKFCGAEFENYSALHGRRKHLLECEIYECPECQNESIVRLAGDRWSCLICDFEVDGSTNCEECGNEIPNSERIYKVAMSDIDANDFKYLCPCCAEQARDEESYIGYEIS